MKLKLWVSFVAAFCVTLLATVIMMIFITIVKERRIQDLAYHSDHIADLIQHDETIRHFVEDQPKAPPAETIEQLFLRLVQGDPFLEELSLLDPFGKMRIRVSSPNESEPPAPIKRAAPSLHEMISTGQPSYEEDSGEYFIPLQSEANARWGVLRVRWRHEASTYYFEQLTHGAWLGSAILFGATVLLVFFMMRLTYDREHRRLADEVRMAAGGDFSHRIDPKDYSTGIAAVGVYMNRLLRDLQEERSKASVLDDALRDAERISASAKKNADLQSKELESVRNEMRDGIRILLELVWSGVMIVDRSFRFHYSNTAAERLLRFIQHSPDGIDDERLKRTLKPLFNDDKINSIDDLCAWPKPGWGRALSCRVRAAEIPSSESEPLYFVMLREESGYPSTLGSSYFSERVLRDFISSQGAVFPWGVDAAVGTCSNDNAIQRFQTCLKRIVYFHDLERGKIESPQVIRFNHWLRDRFLAEDLFSDHLNVNIPSMDSDVTLNVSESAAAELIDCLIVLTGILSDSGSGSDNAPIEMRASTDSMGKPVLTLSTTCESRKQAQWMQDVLEDRCEPFSESHDDYGLMQLERDICFSVFRCVKNLLRIKVETSYSETKKTATIHIIFTQTQQSAASSDNEPVNQTDGVDRLIRNYFQPS